MALRKPGHARIIAVMNDAFGKPTQEHMPFNLRHRRFPMTYTLPEDATEEERKLAKKSLTDQLESAIRLVIDSPDFKALAQPAHTPSALEAAVLYQKDVDYNNARSSLRSSEGAERVGANVRTLFTSIEAKCEKVNAKVNRKIEFGSQIKAYDQFQTCVLRSRGFGLGITWEQRSVDSLEGAKLAIRELQGPVRIPGESLAGVHLVPVRTLNQTFYVPTLSPEYELGWVKSPVGKLDPSFVSAEELADASVRQFVNLIRKHSV